MLALEPLFEDDLIVIKVDTKLEQLRLAVLGLGDNLDARTSNRCLKFWLLAVFILEEPNHGIFGWLLEGDDPEVKATSREHGAHNFGGLVK